MASVTQPTGTVTMVFTDIEGSTRLLEELGTGAYREALAWHRDIVRDSCSRHGGYEVDYEGDSFFYAFGTAQDAVSAAHAFMLELASGPIRVRVGIHTGEPELDPPKYVGMDVHRAARIMAAGHGGQIVLSQSTVALLEPGAFSVRELGAHRLKDLGTPLELSQLEADGLGAEFPALRTLQRSNLPVPASLLVGRIRELAEVTAQIVDAHPRVLTLTGPGGTGKTRLALQAAAEVADLFPGGTWWVALAPLRDPSSAIPTIVQAAGIEDEGVRDPRDVLADSLVGRKGLLVLDNAEHLLPRLARDLEYVVVRAPDLRILVTSRSPLRIEGERAYHVPPLRLEEATTLFVERARDAEPSFVETPDVGNLCERLECLPLAVELAAARTTLFTPTQLLQRIGNRLDLLKAPRTDPRHGTLRATIEWSYDLLDGEARSLFARLAVFGGGATLDAVESVVSGEPDALQALLEQSLVRRRMGANGEPRYWMLETIREFALELLEEDPAAADLRPVHAVHYSGLLAAQAMAVREWDEHAMATALDELDNGRLALAWAVEHRDASVAASVIWGLWFLWATRGFGEESRAAAEAWLELDPRLDVDDLATVHGFTAVSEILRFAGARERALLLKRRYLPFLREHPDPEFHGRALGRWIAPTLSDMASIEYELGQLEDATAHAAEALRLRRMEGRPAGVAHALGIVAEIAAIEGDLNAAVAHGEEIVALYAESGQQVEALGARVGLAEFRMLQGSFHQCIRDLRDVIEPAAQSDVALEAEVARIVAAVAARTGRMQEAAALEGYYVATLERAGLAEWRGARERGAVAGREVREALGQTYHAARAEGAALDLDAMLALANDVLKAV